jgi:ABC-type lipoprotein export system ATPase subunit
LSKYWVETLSPATGWLSLIEPSPVTEVTPIIALDGVSKIYDLPSGRVSALRNATFNIYPGEYVVISGPSGSGKSTLLNVIGLLDTPSSGQLAIDGILTNDMSQDRIAALRGSRIGFVFQRFHLLPYLTALENVCLPQSYAQAGNGGGTETALDLLQKMALKDRAQHLPGQLSGGQQQRVAIARSLINRPSFLLADEPTGALDQATGDDILHLFERLNEAGMTLIIVSHDPKIEARAKRRINIVDGFVEQA